MSNLTSHKNLLQKLINFQQAHRQKKQKPLSKLNQSLQNLHQPQSPILLKFPKGKRLRKQTSMQMLTQSKPVKPLTKKIFQKYSNICSFGYDDLNSCNFKKRCKKPGLYHINSLQTVTAPIQCRSIQDIGIDKNRKNMGIHKIINNNPILIGQLHNQVNKSFRKTQDEPRKLRDRGEGIRQHFLWQKIQPKTYLERFRATRKVQ